MTAIYGLYDQEGCLRYIGKANCPKKRLASHMRDMRRRTTPLYCWLAKHGLPEMRVLVEDCIDWKADERRLIAEARARGDRLLNIADGGDEPHCDAATRRKNGQKLSERIKSDPEFASIRNIKRTLGQYLHSPLVSEDRKALMRVRMMEIAAINPRMFGAWAKL